MRLTCLEDNLNRGLATVGRAVPSRTTLPITQHVYLATDQGRLKLSATNLEVAITTWVGAKIEEEGAITVPARLLTEFVRSLPEEPISLYTEENPTGLNLQCARWEARLNGAIASDFPPIPAVEGGMSFQIDSQSLRSAISQVVFAAATEGSRPVLTGVKLELEGEWLTLAAADGFRLAVNYVQLRAPAAESLSVVMPAKTLQELNHLLGDQEEIVEILVNSTKSQVMFRLSNVELVSHLLPGSFPNYAQLIPEGYTSRVLVDLQEFRRATRTASIFARDGSGIVRLQAIPSPESPSKLVIYARAEEVGEQQGEVDAQVEGEEAKIAFNGKYLSDILGVLDCDKVALETSSSSSPGVFRPVGSDRYVHVVMPMFVQW